MNPARLTHPLRLGHKATMLGGTRRRSFGAYCLAMLAAVPPAGLLSGCITVNAPEEPIVIELNINITQEVIYRLAEDVRENIEENPEIF